MLHHVQFVIPTRENTGRSRSVRAKRVIFVRHARLAFLRNAMVQQNEEIVTRVFAKDTNAKDKAYEHPFYWASFVLVGSPA